MKKIQEENSKKTQSPIKQRIIEFAKFRCHSVAEFERICDLSPSYIGCIRKSPSAEIFKKMTDAFPEMNLNWIMYGEGAMLKEAHKDLLNEAMSVEIPTKIWDEIRQLNEAISSQQKTIQIQNETILSQAESLKLLLSKSSVLGPGINGAELAEK